MPVRRCRTAHPASAAALSAGPRRGLPGAPAFAPPGSRPALARAAAPLVLGAVLAALLAIAAPCALLAGTAVVDIDTADAAALAAALPGIGPVKARAIVAYRERHGPFADLDALLEVRGIGPRTLARIRAALGPPDGPTRGPGGDGDGYGASVTSSGDDTARERAAREAVRALVGLAVADAERARGGPAGAARAEPDGASDDQ